jgi:hypothetical protein
MTGFNRIKNHFINPVKSCHPVQRTEAFRREIVKQTEGEQKNDVR